MEGFNNFETQNYENSIGKAMLFSIVGMLIGAAANVIVLGVFDLRWWWAVGAVLGGAVSYAWKLGKGPSGLTRQLVMIVLSILGSLLGFVVGYAWIIYNEGFGADFFIAFEIVLEEFFIGFEYLFDEYGIITRDVLIGAVIAIAVSWKDYEDVVEEEVETEIDTTSETEDISLETEEHSDEVPTLMLKN